MTPWFGPKTVGYGIGPIRWQGWLVCVLAAAIAVGAAMVMTRAPGTPRWIPLTIMLLDLVVFVGILAAKTEGD